MLSRSRLIIVAGLALALAGGTFAWLRLDRPAASATLTLYGNVDIREIQPAFNASGPITRVVVQEGAVVKRGELLATLDNTRYAAALAQAEGQMRYQEQLLAKLLAGSRPEEVAQAKATMDALR
jgi:HlyD family secretion protein